MAVAGCAGTGTSTGGQPLQSLAGSSDEQSQAMTVLVNDFEFSPDVEVVDREFDAKLSAKLGGAVGPGAIKTIAFKRVADEIGATVVAILHEEVSLKAKVRRRRGYPAEGPTLVITGRLRATEKAPTVRKTRSARRRHDRRRGAVAGHVGARTILNSRRKRRAGAGRAAGLINGRSMPRSPRCLVA